MRSLAGPGLTIHAPFAQLDHRVIHHQLPEPVLSLRFLPLNRSPSTNNSAFLAQGENETFGRSNTALKTLVLPLREPTCAFSTHLTRLDFSARGHHRATAIRICRIVSIALVRYVTGCIELDRDEPREWTYD